MHLGMAIGALLTKNAQSSLAAKKLGKLGKVIAYETEGYKKRNGGNGGEGKLDGDGVLGHELVKSGGLRGNQNSIGGRRTNKTVLL